MTAALISTLYCTGSHSQELGQPVIICSFSGNDAAYMLFHSPFQTGNDNILLKLTDTDTENWAFLSFCLF